MRLSAIALGFCVLLPAAIVLAQGSDALDEQRALAELQNIADELTVTMRAAQRTRNAQCLAVVGQATFCGCLDKHMPVSLSFLDYVQATTNTAKQLAKWIPDKDRHGAFLRARAVRNYCVAVVAGTITPNERDEDDELIRQDLAASRWNVDRIGMRLESVRRRWAVQAPENSAESPSTEKEQTPVAPRR